MRLSLLLLAAVPVLASPAPGGESLWRGGAGRKVASAIVEWARMPAAERRALESNRLRRIDAAGKLQVRVDVKRLDPPALAELVAAGLEVERSSAELGAVRGWVAADRVLDVAALANVRHVRRPDYAFTRIGSVQGEHAARIGCDDIRRRFGVDGSGVRVGVISDGIDNIASSQASGDAPVVSVPDSPLCHRGEGDEGAAMIELVHDCAPGAEIAFCGPTDDMDMVDCAKCLGEVFGAQIIVDDLGFFAQPFYSDGPVAEAVKAQTERGVAWFSATGNEAQSHYQNRFRACGRNDNRHAFTGLDCDLDFEFAGLVLVILQWDEPFGSATNDYDLCVPGVGCSEDVQDGDDDPIEAIAMQCGGLCRAAIEVKKRSGAERNFEVFVLGYGASYSQLLEYQVLTDSVFGHPCVADVVAVAAIDVNQVDLNRVESFSSVGPCRISFPTAESRNKPDLSGFDGIANTGPGDFPTRFYGTSAAAPSVAGVAALLLQMNPAMRGADLRRVLTRSAVDIEQPGYDLSSGFGRADGMAAAQLVTPAPRPSSTPTRTIPPTSTRTTPRSPVPTPTPGPCYGDCNDGGSVSVDELVSGVSIVLGNAPLSSCPVFDSSGDGQVTVNELIQAVNAALVGCVR